MKKETIKKYLPYAIALIVFLCVTIIYCFPMLQGKKMNQGDTKNWEGMVQETLEFNKDKSGRETTWWTNSMFGGMPTFQMSDTSLSNVFLGKVESIVKLNLPSAMGIIICYLICFFILLRAIGINKWLSICGSVAIAFSSYFFIIIAAGHVTKAFGIAYISAVMGGFIFIFKKKYYWGVPITMFFSALGLLKHPQMTYYIFLTIALLYIAEVVIHVKEKRYKDLGIATSLFLVSVLVAFGTRYGSFKANSQYLSETMRGGHSEIVTENSEETLSNASGLSLEYATQWSYGIDETMTLLIPNFKGGSSHYKVGEKSEIYETLIKNGVPRRSAAEFCQSLPMYWGTQPFTSGPVYVGAIVVFLFVLGIFIVKGPYKWALIAATLFSIFLSWGHNMMWLTKFFFVYFPLYSKFRAVSSILVVAEIAMPLLGFLAIKEILDKKIDRQKALKYTYMSAGITAGICLFFALVGPALYNFTTPSDGRMFSQLSWLMDSVISYRKSMFRTDALRSMFFILASAGIVVLYLKDKLKFKYFALSLSLLLVVDMWPVNKRYFGNEYFVSSQQDSNYFKMMPHEKQILSDPDPYFRVLNLTTSTFNDSRTSYYLKSVGGYHGAKLRRYQDLIDQHITQNNMEVVNMLNTKYFIVNGGDGQPVPQLNRYAMGNCWFVDNVEIVENANEESNALNHIDLKTTAVTDKKFASFVDNKSTTPDPTAEIVLTKYAPNALEYKSKSNVAKTAVFSDIYYPYGWKAFIDEQPVDHFRVNYVLRALNIPEGEHNIRFVFEPDAIYKGQILSIICLVIIFLTIVFCIVNPIIKSKGKKVSV